jgi:aspartate carbamoyltransferase catalytic subunit
MFKAEKLISIDDLDKEDILELYETTKKIRSINDQPNKKISLLKEFTVANLFFEESTRTRISFELAEKRLSAESISFSAGSSSVKKGETLIDTVRNLIRMKIDMIVIRHSQSGSAHFISSQTGLPVINAGDGTNEHPTQALLDLFTLYDNGLNDKDINIALLGDVLHSRVAGSAIKLWQKLGIRFEIFSPKTVQRNFAAKKTNMSRNLKDFNILYNLRIQKERQNVELIPGEQEYHSFFGIKENNPTKDQYIMHPGPINRGLELDSKSADSPNSLILNQVSMGVSLRMAVLYLLAKKKGSVEPL